MGIEKLPAELLLSVVAFLIPAKSPAESNQTLCSARLVSRSFNSAILHFLVATLNQAAAAKALDQWIALRPHIFDHFVRFAPILLLEKVRLGEEGPLIDAVSRTTDYILEHAMVADEDIQTVHSRHRYWRALCFAAVKDIGHEQLLTELWTGGYDTHDTYTSTLIAAVACDDLALLHALLQKKDADVKECWPFGNPLSLAIMLQNKPAITMLLDSDKNVAVVDIDSEKPFLVLASILRTEISHGDDGDGAVFRTLLPRYPHVLLEWEDDEQTLLSLAAERGNVEIVTCLLENEYNEYTNLYSYDDTGMTPVEHAERNGHVEIVELLKERAKKDFLNRICGW
ncbi:hypothetical protein AJ80_05930 [Polytolypa hystricis UAMH7299]|uniref:Uncharacterized protein n=1 Tax=Polytolypa hystricis (strain UAMH7299) TaxID=1447883 RepID=A0A2B7XZ90_POLH7|nr:hypothetical protein AJ80_05930 [Polytolypa hystricis UAMH7299]